MKGALRVRYPSNIEVILIKKLKVKWFFFMIFHGKIKAYKAVFRVTIDRTCAVVLLSIGHRHDIVNPRAILVRVSF